MVWRHKAGSLELKAIEDKLAKGVFVDCKSHSPSKNRVAHIIYNKNQNSVMSFGTHDVVIFIRIWILNDKIDCVG